MSAIVGRDAELSQIRDFLADVRQRTVALSIWGPAGIGKSTLWHAAIEAGREAGFRIVTARPAEAEGQLPFASLNDLLGDLLDDIDPDLPAPQLLALQAAMLRAPMPSQERLEPLAISLAALGLIREAAAAGPMLIAVDDLQWADPASASVLEFVVRRLETESIGLIATRRSVEPVEPSTGVLSGIPPDRLRDVHVAPLPAREIGRLLASGIGLEVPPSTVSRIHRLAGGNVLHAFEVGRAMQRRGITELEGSQDIPPSLSGLLKDRLAGLSTAGSRLIEYASALSHARISTLEAALGPAETAAGIENAGAAHIIESDGVVVRFSHPLLAAEAYGAMSEADRREVHGRLAEVVTEVEERATHLDLSSTGPDEKVAVALDAAALSADERGAPEVAADYAERAAQRTEGDGVTLARRRLSAGQLHDRAGSVRQARSWLESALAEAPKGPLRATILAELGQVRLVGEDWEAARKLLDAAVSEAGNDVRLRIEALVLRAGASFGWRQDRDRGTALIEEAMRLAEQLGEPQMIARVIGPYAMWMWALRRRGLDELEQRSEALGDAGDHLRIRDHFDVQFGHVNAARGRHARARMLYARQLSRAEKRGDYASIPVLLVGVTRADFYAGRSEDALVQLAEAERLARVTGQDSVLAWALGEIITVNARIGRAEAAWQAARELFALPAHVDREGISARHQEELAALEISRRSYRTALYALTPAGLLVDGAVDTTLPIRAEALIGLGRLDEAADALERYRAESGGKPVFGHDSADLDAGYGRAAAQLAVARGDLDEATRLIDAAIATYVADNDDWSRARALLVAADIHRRARRRNQAQSAATEALALFEYFGAALWVERAKEVQGRIGLTSQERTDGLTTTQGQVAELAAEGLTNRQIAGRLFMSPHTVEAHLSAAYRALGIQSRRELATRLRSAPDTPADSIVDESAGS